VTTTSAAQVPALDLDDHRLSWRDKRRLNRQLRLRDQIGARLAELDRLADILNRAADLIKDGWLQDSWFSYRDVEGREKTVTAYNVTDMAGRPVVAACLVGAVVEAGGGLSEVRTSGVQRALDLTWHTLFSNQAEPIRWNPAPQIRMHHVQQLTRWNDHPSRTASQVETLLRRSVTAARSEASRLRSAAEPATTT
jgi:hypothetical protein